MNPDKTMAIRVAIRDTCDQLRPPVMGSGLPEPTRTALQAHLDALLKEELRALTWQAPEGDLTGFAAQNEKFAQDMGLRQASADAMVASMVPTPWYPDDSGDWVEGHPRDLPPDTPVLAWLYVKERNGKYYNPSPEPLRARDLSVLTGIVAYKVVKP